MLGLIVVTGFILYFWLLYWVTRRAYLWAIQRGHTKLRSAMVGFFGFLLIYLPIFWDFLPLLVMKKYYCAKDGGFTLYQTPEQWISENPDRARNTFFYKRVQPIDKNGFRAIGNHFVSRAATTTVPMRIPSSCALRAWRNSVRGSAPNTGVMARLESITRRRGMSAMA